MPQDLGCRSLWGKNWSTWWLLHSTTVTCTTWCFLLTSLLSSYQASAKILLAKYWYNYLFPGLHLYEGESWLDLSQSHNYQYNILHFAFNLRISPQPGYCSPNIATLIYFLTWFARREERCLSQRYIHQYKTLSFHFNLPRISPPPSPCFDLWNISSTGIHPWGVKWSISNFSNSTPSCTIPPLPF